MSIQKLPTDVLSSCISYLDQESHTKMPLVNSEFQKSCLCPTSFEGNTFVLSTRIWKYLLCSSNVQLESILFKFKLVNKMQIEPIYILSTYQEAKASFMLKYISRVFTNLSYILIDDCSEACDLLDILPIFNKQHSITLHLRMKTKMDIDVNAMDTWHFPEIANQIQLYLLANANNHNLKHMVYENFDDFSDIYTTNIHIVSGLQKISVINCDAYTFPVNANSKFAHKIKELELNPICVSECLNEMRYFFQNNYTLETLTLSADSYSFGICGDNYDQMKDIINIRNLKHLNLIVNNNCNQNEDFFCLVNCLGETVELKTLHIEWFWHKRMDSLYIIYMLSEFVANALQEDTEIFIKCKIVKDETDSDKMVMESLYGIERFLIKLNNTLIAMESKCYSGYSNLLSKLTIGIPSLVSRHGQNADLCNIMPFMDDIMKYVVLN